MGDIDIVNILDGSPLHGERAGDIDVGTLGRFGDVDGLTDC